MLAVILSPIAKIYCLSFVLNTSNFKNEPNPLLSSVNNLIVKVWLKKVCTIYKWI